MSRVHSLVFVGALLAVAIGWRVLLASEPTPTRHRLETVVQTAYMALPVFATYYALEHRS